MTAGTGSAAREQHLGSALRHFLEVAARFRTSRLATLIYFDDKYSGEDVKEVGKWGPTLSWARGRGVRPHTWL